jgi:hypothetical protein
MSFLKPAILSPLLIAFSLASTPLSSVHGKSAWVDQNAAKQGITFKKHVALKPITLTRKSIDKRTYLGAWQWPSAKKTMIEVSVVKHPGSKPLRAMLEEMDGKPLVEVRADKRPSLRTEILFEAVLSRRFLIQDSAQNRVIEFTISIQGVDRWMQRNPTDIRKEFKEALWVLTKMARSLRFTR